MDREAQIATIIDLVTPVLASLGLECFDVQVSGGGRSRTVRVLVDREGGVDLDAIAAASQEISPVLDREPTLSGPYLLEVSSPGVERPLRRPEHFRRAIGETVSVKYRTDTGPQRLRGALASADDDGVTVTVDGDDRRLAFTDITDARTVFEWGPSPRPGGARSKEKSRS